MRYDPRNYDLKCLDVVEYGRNRTLRLVVSGPGDTEPDRRVRCVTFVRLQNSGYRGPFTLYCPSDPSFRPVEVSDEMKAAIARWEASRVHDVTGEYQMRNQTWRRHFSCIRRHLILEARRLSDPDGRDRLGLGAGCRHELRLFDTYARFVRRAMRGKSSTSHITGEPHRENENESFTHALRRTVRARGARAGV